MTPARLAVVALLVVACRGDGDAARTDPPPASRAVAVAGDDAAAKVPTDEIELLVLGMT
jgi:hypothetical protein